MKIAVPTENGLLCPHFGHSPQFTIMDINEETKSIDNSQTVTPPPHDMGVLPAWLSEIHCTHIIAGGMGGRAVMLFEQNGICVVLGAPQATPEQVVLDFLNDRLASGNNPCDDPAFHEGHDNCSSHG